MITRQRIGLVLTGVVVGVGLTGLGIVASRQGDGARPSIATGPAAKLSGEGRELVDLAQKGLDATYHARYLSVLADPRAEGTQMTMDVWRKGPLTRQEVAVQAQDVRTRSGTFQVPPNTVQCSQVGDRPWSCQPPAASKPSESPAAQIKAELGRGDIKARDDSIGGVAVRCFTFPAGGDLTETCLMQDGAIARMATASSHFELVAFSRTVPDEVFSLPAPAPAPIAAG